MNAYNKLQIEHAKLKKSLDELQKYATFASDFESYAAAVYSGRIKPSSKPPKPAATERVLNTIWSDLHFGSDLLSSETGGPSFGTVEEARRMAGVVDQLATYKPQYRKNTDLNIYLLGDIIQNSLHDPRDGAPLAEQQARAIHILSQAVGVLASKFKKVSVYCTPGNHGRNTARHFSRATNQKWDAIETMTYVAIKYACLNLKNVQFTIPKTPFVVADVLGAKMFLTHGDTVLKPGNPGSSIKVKDLENQANRINAGLPDHHEYKVFGVGHVHTPSITQLPNGSVLITNGALVPIDQFSVSIGVLESQCGQWLWESTKEHAVGDSRLVRVGQEQDKDRSLDKLIVPWKGF